MHSEIEKRVQAAIGEKVFAGCVIGIVRADGSREVLPFGNFTYEPDSPIVAEDTIYDLASVTKSIPVASLVAMLIAEGRLGLADTAKRYLPELQNDHGATIEDLLTYRVSGTRLSALRNETVEGILQHIFAHGFDGPAGESKYTNLPAFLLGLILERVGGKPLDTLAEERFFKPLGMLDTTFFPDILPTRSNIAPTEMIDGEEIRGIVHDESARVFSRAHRAVGHAGVFSIAPDLLNFLEALLRGQLPVVLEAAQKGLGWQKAEPWFMGSHAGEGAFGKTGFTGTSVAVSPARGIGLVILSNRTYPERPPDATSLTSAINLFRADIADIVFH